MFDCRDDIGGNCRTKTDENGIEVHLYGSHIFHTDDEDVWRFVGKFTEFNEYRHKVVAVHDGMSYYLPINLSLLNQFFKRKMTPSEAEALMESVKGHNGNPSNLEEKAVSMVGKDVYRAFFKNYTEKQWGCDASSLSPSVISRIPVRYNYDTNYFNDRFQGIPLNGYQSMFRKMLSNPLITVTLCKKCSWTELKDDITARRYDAVLYTGALDELFDYRLGELPWRSLRFETTTASVRDFQGTSVVNYVDKDAAYTRIHEFKHYHPEDKGLMSFEKTVVQREYPKRWSRGDERFYPVENDKSKTLHSKYLSLLKDEFNGKIYAGGRLGLFRYFDMDDAVSEAIKLSRAIMKKEKDNKQ